MGAQAVLMRDRNWYKAEREPAKAHDQLVFVKPTLNPALKGLPLMLTPQIIAERLSFSAYTVCEWCKEYRRTGGKTGLKSQKVRGQWRISLDDLAIFLALQDVKGGGRS